MNEKERKFKDKKTTELLDFVGLDIPYTKDKERDKQEDMKVELEKRNPFKNIKHEIDSINSRLNGLRKNVDNLLKHKHTKDGKVVVDIEEIRGLL